MCTRILLKNTWGTFVARNMDWADTPDSADDIIVFPRGIKRSGNTKENPLSWTSLYGSVVTTMYDMGSPEGMNEKGLGAHLHYLNSADFGVRDTNKKGLFAILWIQFFLDNFQNVQEAVDYLSQNDIQVVTTALPGSPELVGFHICLEDTSGDSVILEYLDGGKLYINHSKDYRVFTNGPRFEEQLKNLSLYDGYGGTLPVPGTSGAKDRFVRATYYSDRAQENPLNIEENVKMMLGFSANVSQMMLKTPTQDPSNEVTKYTTVLDLTHLKYYFSFTLYHSLISLDLTKLDFSEGQKEKVFDFKHINTHGDILDKLLESDSPFEFAKEQ